MKSKEQCNLVTVHWLLINILLLSQDRYVAASVSVYLLLMVNILFVFLIELWCGPLHGPPPAHYYGWGPDVKVLCLLMNNS